MAKSYGVYVRADARGNVIEINSDCYLVDTEGYMLIDEGTAKKYKDAATQYLEKGLYGFNGAVDTPNYKLVDGALAERTEAEKALDPWSDPPGKSETEQLREQTEMLTECILEMAGIVYE